MISDIAETQEHINNCENILYTNLNNDNNTAPNDNTVDLCVSLSKDTHEKIYDFLIDEIKSYKQSGLEKEQQIKELNNKIEELSTQLNELEIKLSKMNNIGLLIKLKENLTNKQNEFESEINNISGDDNSHDDNKNDGKLRETLEEKSKMELTLENSKSNIVIEEFDKQTIKPRKRPNMFRRHF